MTRPALPALALVLLLLVPPGAAHHASPAASDEVSTIEQRPGVTWRAVEFAPDGSHALLVGSYGEGNDTRGLIARWTPESGLEEIRNRTGGGLVDLSFRSDGTSLVLGIRDQILLGEPGSYRNVWDESEFAENGSLTFYGLGTSFHPTDGYALVAGSSLLRIEDDGELTREDVIHGGRGAFFRTVAWNPSGSFAWAEAAVQRDGQAVFGTVWRTTGEPPLDQEDNVQIYGRFAPGSALLNTIAFAPNGSFGLLAGRDGAQASVLTWASTRTADHAHPNRSQPHDHRWRYQPTTKQPGPITCIDWHPSGRYALATGLDRHVVGYVDARSWAPLMHAGPELFGCAFHPSGAYGLAVGEDGTVLRVTPGEDPMGTVVSPEAGTLTPPRANQTFLVDVIDRGGAGNVTVTGHVGANGTERVAERSGPWWALDVNTTDLDDGTHTLHVTVQTDAGSSEFTHPFLVNNEEFTPSAPTLRAPTGLEGDSTDADGTFKIHWTPLDAPVVYEVEQQRVGEANQTRTLRAGGGDNLTVRVDADGSYRYRVRAVNGFGQASNWSESVIVNVVLDSDGDGVPDRQDPQPQVANAWGDSDDDGISDDREYRQCSDPFDGNSTPSSDDDGDGLPNGVECQQGSDPLDPDSPTPQTDDTNETNTTDPDEDNGVPAPSVILAVAILGVVAAARTRRDQPG